VHEVTLKEKLLADSSNPIQSLAANQEVMSDSFISSSNPTQSLAAHQGNITKILDKIISAIIKPESNKISFAKTTGRWNYRN
jgi:hypothetical protein